jgi:glyoxylase-like metal-dependent hydrolase (beta-lactamase superfamily II)
MRILTDISPAIYYYPFTASIENNCNSVLLDGDEMILIDPGHKHLWPKLKSSIIEDGLKPEDIKMVIHTHCHPDHMEAGQVLEDDYNSVQAMSPQEKEFYDGPGLKFFPWMGLDTPRGHIGKLIPEGPFALSDKTLQIYLTPGHTPGGICIHWPEAGLLIGGDLVFRGSFGRTDFPGGNSGLLFDSIKRMRDLDNVELILTGHGPSIVGKANVASNYKDILSFFR